jgi:outer membrane lipoprotein-sorting protein
MLQLTRAIATAFTVAAVTLPSLAQAQALPSATEIFDRHVQEIGGKDAVLAISSIRQKGTLELAAMGITADVTMAMARPNKSSMIMAIPGLGEIQQGFNGEVAWENNPMAGPRIAEGEELETRKAAAGFSESFGIYDPARYESVQVLEKTTFAGEEAYKIELKRKVGPAVLSYFSVASGLFIGSQTSVVSPMGTIEVNAVAGDYKTFGKIRMPTKLMQSQSGQDITITFTDITFDTVTDDAFALPPAIQALVKKP